MITSQGMLVCSFNLKQRFSRGEENVYPLNQQYELKLENETLRIEDAAKFFQIFCHIAGIFAQFRLRNSGAEAVPAVPAERCGFCPFFEIRHIAVPRENSMFSVTLL